MFRARGLRSSPPPRSNRRSHRLGTAPETPRPDATENGRRCAVEIRRAVHFRAKRADVAVTHVVNQKDDEVGLCRFRVSGVQRSQRHCGDECKSVFHEGDASNNADEFSSEACPAFMELQGLEALSPRPS